jgi:hypothetical protein
MMDQVPAVSLKHQMNKNILNKKGLVVGCCCTKIVNMSMMHRPKIENGQATCSFKPSK